VAIIGKKKYKSLRIIKMSRLRRVVKITKWKLRRKRKKKFKVKVKGVKVRKRWVGV
jgi:hypothetical protein